MSWWRSSKPSKSAQRVGNLARRVARTKWRDTLANYGESVSSYQDTPRTRKAKAKAKAATKAYKQARTQYYSATKPKSQ